MWRFWRPRGHGCSALAVALRRNIVRCVATSRAVCSHAPCWHRGRGCSAPSALSRCRHDRHCARQRAQTNYGRVGCHAVWDGAAVLEHAADGPERALDLQAIRRDGARVCAGERRHNCAGQKPSQQCLSSLLRLSVPVLVVAIMHGPCVCSCVRAYMPQRLGACVCACVCACVRGQSDSCGRATSTSTL